jgi:endonuclease/exonuclease/phosphatase family metal-dependent hydrolase
MRASSTERELTVLVRADMLTEMGRASKPLRICEYNVENLFISMDYYEGDDLRTLSEERWANAALPQLKDRQKPLKRVWGVAESIRDIDPDVAMLVEVGGLESLENLNRYFLDDTYDVHFVAGNARRGIDLGFLVRKGLGFKTETRSNRDFPIEVATWTGKQIDHFSRDVAELRLFDDSGVLRLVLLLTHLKSQISTETDIRGKDTRTAEAFALGELYQRRRADNPGVPVVVGGDLNAELGSLELEPLCHTDLVDFHDLRGTPREERITLVHFDYSGSPAPLVFDYLLLSPDLANRLVLEDSFVYRYKNFYGVPDPLPETRPQRWHMPSDHYPLVLTIQLEE